MYWASNKAQDRTVELFFWAFCLFALLGLVAVGAGATYFVLNYEVDIRIVKEP